MSDYSQPDPAGTPGVPEKPEYPSVMGEDEEIDPKDELAVVDANASCLKCAHFEVCAIFKGIQPLMDDWHTDDEDVPVDVEKLAWHCREYEPEDE